MGATVFYEGSAELATLSNTFSVGGTATDPTTVSLAITTPSGTTTTYTYAGGTLTKSATGVYTKDVACTEDGTWKYVWTGTGAASDIQAGTWTVFHTDLERLYCSMEELKSRVGLSDTVDDFELRLAIEAASRWIDTYTGRRFYRVAETRTFAVSGSLWLDVDDLVSVTSVKTDAAGDGTFETTWAVGDYQLLPVNTGAAPEALPYTRLRAVGSYVFPYGFNYGGRGETVEIVGVWGWPTIPAPVKNACLFIASDLFKAKDAPFGVSGYSEWGPVRIRPNPVAAQLLAAYRRNPILVG